MTIHLPIIPRVVAPQALFNPELFRSDIVQFAAGCPNIRWEKAFPCPCAWKPSFAGVEGEVGGESRPGCEKCRNSGVYYVRQSDTYAIVTSAGATATKSGKLTGDSWMDVQAKFTCLPETAPAHLDRLSILNAWIQVSERRTRRRTVESCRFPLEEREIVSASPNNSHTPICHKETLIECAWASSSGVFQATLAPDVDLRVVDGNIDWTIGDDLGSAPPVGCDYTATYWARPRYIIQGHPFIHRPSVTKKPSQVGVNEAAGSTDMPVAAVGYLELVGVAAGTTGV